MKAGIHPNYVESTVTCACGNVFTTRSTKPQLRTDLCNVCHPFYTGEQRIVDTAGQVERFMRRLETAQAAEGRQSKRKQRLAARIADREAQQRGDQTEDQDEGESLDAPGESDSSLESPAATSTAGVASTN